MIYREDRCVECGMHCLGADCPNRNVLIKRCDCCGRSVDTLYHWDKEEWCLDCIIENLEEVRDEED